MNIGETIKKLRKDKNVTQEKLADYLGITYQAVSKWENGTALPDITLVVPLANFFSVSADYLFKLNAEENDGKAKEYENQCKNLFNMGNMQAAVTLMREVLAEYPRNFQFMLWLARAIQWMPPDKEPQPADNEARNAEIIALCERILEDCTDNHIRHETMQILCIAYKNAGQREKAIKVAIDTAPFSASRDWLLSMVYEGEKLTFHRQGNVLAHGSFTAYELFFLSENENMPTENKIAHMEAALAIFDTIFYDGNALYHHFWMNSICSRLAECHAPTNAVKTMHYLLRAEKHAIGADNIPEEDTPYTSIFVDRHTHSTKKTFKSNAETQCNILLNRLAHEVYAPLHNDSEFIALRERLGSAM